MEEDGGESYGEDEDNEEMLGVNDVTSQLAAAGWQHGVHLFLFFYFIFYYTVRQCCGGGCYCTKLSRLRNGLAAAEFTV